MGDARKNEEGTESEEPLDVLEYWSQGPITRTNEAWMTMIKKKTCEDMEGVSQQRISPRELDTHTHRFTE